MPFIDDAKKLISDGEIKEEGFDLLTDTMSALLGDCVSAGRVIVTLGQSPFFFREKLFWGKVEQYLNGVYVEEEDRAKLCAKLVENGTNEENTKRLIECIDRAETSRKIRYLINATRCLLTDFIDRELFFRICKAIVNTLDEDLQFLRDNLQKDGLHYDNSTQGLYSSGLMYNSLIGEEPEYSFTPLAFAVDQYAVSYDDIERYPNPLIKAPCINPNVGVPTISKEEIVALFPEETGKQATVHMKTEIPIEEF